MNRIAMFLLPIAALVLLGGVFVYQWWQNRVGGPSMTPPINEGIQVEEEGRDLLRGFGVEEDNAVQMDNLTEEPALGVVRWSDDGSTVTVLADLEPVSGVTYQVWMQGEDEVPVKLGVMRLAKAGYIFEYTPTNPLSGVTTFIVSKERLNDAVLEERVLEGSVSR